MFQFFCEAIAIIIYLVVYNFILQLCVILNYYAFLFVFFQVNTYFVASFFLINEYIIENLILYLLVFLFIFQLL